jgi:hypothetical protein
MGKAKIVSNEGSGFYTVDLLRDTTRVEIRLTKTQSKITVLEKELGTVDHNIGCLEADIEQLEQERDLDITNGDSTQDVTREIQKKSVLLGQARHVKGAVEASLITLKRRAALYQDEINRCANLRTLASCVDYTDDLPVGEVVGVIDYGRQSSEAMGAGWRPILQPGHGDRSTTYNQARDGINHPAVNMTAASWLYNYILEPGARAWRPLYRIGRARNVRCEQDVADVTLELSYSRNTRRSTFPHQADKLGTLQDVKIDYMHCPASVVTEGDKVVVEFAGREAPAIIGFADSPRRCQTEHIVMGFRFAYNSGRMESQDIECGYKVIPYYRNVSVLELSILHIEDLMTDEEVSTILTEDKDVFNDDDWNTIDGYLGTLVRGYRKTLTSRQEGEGYFDVGYSFAGSQQNRAPPKGSGVLSMQEHYYIYGNRQKREADGKTCDTYSGLEVVSDGHQLLWQIPRSWVTDLIWEHNGSRYTLNTCGSRYVKPLGAYNEGTLYFLDPFWTFATKLD